MALHALHVYGWLPSYIYNSQSFLRRKLIDQNGGLLISNLGFWLVPAVSVEPKQALYPRTSAGEVFFPLGQILNFRVDNSRCDHRLGDGGSQPPTRPACPRGSAYRPLDWPSHVPSEPQVVRAWNQNFPSGPGRWPGGRGRHGPGGITHSRLRPLDSGTEPLPRRRLKAAPGSPKGRICVPWRVSGVGALYRVCHGGARSIVTPNAEAAQTSEAVPSAVNACARSRHACIYARRTPWHFSRSQDYRPIKLCKWTRGLTRLSGRNSGLPMPQGHLVAVPILHMPP